MREAEDDRAAPRETRDPAAILAGLGDAEERTSPDLVLPGYDALGGDAIEHAIERAEGLDDRPTLPPEAPSSDASLDALAAATLFAAADEHGELEAPGSADDRPTLPPEAPSSDASLDALAAATLFAAADEHGEPEAPGSADDRPTLPPEAPSSEASADALAATLFAAPPAIPPTREVVLPEARAAGEESTYVLTDAQMRGEAPVPTRRRAPPAKPPVREQTMVLTDAQMRGEAPVPMRERRPAPRPPSLHEQATAAVPLRERSPAPRPPSLHEEATAVLPASALGDAGPDDATHVVPGGLPGGGTDARSRDEPSELEGEER